MVKVQKPIPKTIKNGAPGLRKVQSKNSKSNSTKRVTKTVKTVELADAIKAENLKTKNGDLNKKKTALVKEPVAKKQKFVQKPLENGKSKKPSVVQEVLEPVKKIESKKKAVVTKGTQPIITIYPVLEEAPVTIKKSFLKKKPIEVKEQQVFNKPVAKKSSALEQEMKKEKRVLPKKKQVAKVQQTAEANIKQTAKKPVTKKKPSLEKKQPKNKELSKKISVVEKEQQPNKKSIVKKKLALEIDVSETVANSLPKKRPITPKGHEVEQKSAKKPLPVEVQDKVGKGEQKKLNSKVLKKLSAKKKKQMNLKNKLRKNVEKLIQENQDKIAKSKKMESPLFEPENFSENKFKDIVSVENIKKVCEALKILVEKEVSEKKTAVFSDYNYFLNVSCYKIPNCPKRMVKLNLTHSLVNTELDDIVLIVPDLQRGAKVDYEPTIQHYDDIFRQCGIENFKVMPFNQLRNEYSSFEAKRKLSNTYERFLCDGRIVGHVVGFCGKHFQKPRTTIHAVNLTNPKTYKREVDQALKRTSYRQLQKGDLTSILVGNHRFTKDQLAENIVKVIDQLKTIYPGGYANIRNMHIKIDITGTSSLPIYVSLTGAPDDVPNVIGPREQRMIKLKKQANEILSKFCMNKMGEFVKLSNAQIKSKQEMRETRAALTKENVDELEPPLKKKAKKQVEPQKSDDNEANEEDEGDDETGEVSEEESEENDELGEEGTDVSEEDTEEDDDDDEEESEN